MALDDFDYALPPEQIAQQPTPERDAARLLRLPRTHGASEHAHVRDLPELLRPGDLLVRNVTRVVPARLRGHKLTGGAAEALLLGALPGSPGRFRALLKLTGRSRAGAKLRFGPPGAELDAELVERGSVCDRRDPPAPLHSARRRAFRRRAALPDGVCPCTGFSRRSHRGATPFRGAAGASRRAQN